MYPRPLCLTAAARLHRGRSLPLLAAAGVILLAACSRQPTVTPGVPQSDAVPQPAASVRSPAARFTDTLPQVGGPAGYVGSRACQECHEDHYASWHRTFHRTMTQFAASGAVQADFHNVTLTNETTRFVLSQTNDEFWVHMERLPAPGEPNGVRPSADARIGLLTGSHHMQVFWVPSQQGNAQVGFPFTWLIPEKRWVPRSDTFIRPPDASHLSEIWNFTCSRCHTTGVEPHIDSVHHVAATRVGELGIACEACHGPGQRHVEARRAADRNEVVPADVLAREIVHPRKLEPARAAQICGFCHSMKWFDTTENWRQKGFRYRPGDDLEQTTPVIRPTRIESLPGLDQYLERHPELLRDYFWSDGMIRVSGRDYNGLIESPCYKGGAFSCLSCHSLHKSEPDGQLARTRPGNKACTQCHPRYAEPVELAAHTHHLANSTGSECYNCHMPRTTYGVLKAIRSHQISSPNVSVQLATGRPNACTLCHLDKPLGWTATYLNRWFQQSIPTLEAEQTNIADAVRLALTGDAGQRALLVWHLGWEPARSVSGGTWVVPVLAQLLDDPYAAVRYMAERSLRQAANVLPSAYDFVLEPDERPSLRGIVIDRWRSQSPSTNSPPRETLVRADDGDAMQRDFDHLAARRNDQPVRLRE